MVYYSYCFALWNYHWNDISLWNNVATSEVQKLKKDKPKAAHNYDTHETHPESAADNSAYQELDLRNKEPENSYQALRMNTRRRINIETKIEDEANYQELDKVREKENNYQSLNRV